MNNNFIEDLFSYKFENIEKTNDLKPPRNIYDQFTTHQFNLILPKNNLELEEKINVELADYYDKHIRSKLNIYEPDNNTYATIILPKVFKMLDYVVDEKMVRERDFDNNINIIYPSIYIETIVYLLLFTKKVTIYTIHPKILTKVFNFYPWLINLITYNKTIDDQRRFLEKIEDCIGEIEYINNDFKETLKAYHDYFEKREKTPRNLIYFQTLTNMKFTEVAKPFSSLPRGNLFIVNLGYNYEFDSYMYTEVESIKEDFLTEEIISNFKDYENYKIYKQTERYEEYNNGKENSSWYIILNYNTSNNLKDSLFTFNKYQEFTIQQIEVFKNGGILFKTPIDTYIYYLLYRFEARLNRTFEVEHLNPPGVRRLIEENFDEDWLKTKQNWKKYFKSDPLFKEFITCLDEEFEEKYNKEIYLDWMNKYFNTA